jgi:ribosomal protein S12 methylthiotransferase
MSGQVPRRVAQERYDRLMRLQQEITAERNARWLGRAIDVLVEEVDQARATGRHEGQAPEIDGIVTLDLRDLVPAARPAPGQWVPVHVTAVKGYDLVATPSVHGTERLNENAKARAERQRERELSADVADEGK